MFTRAIVRPPAPNFAEGLTTAGLGAPDYKVALQQHRAYCAALEQCGLTLTRLEPDPDYPDSTFVEDVAIVTNACAILTRPGASSRAGEVESMRETLADFFATVSEIEAPGTLDGGDICHAGDHFFIGISERTNQAGARQLGEFLRHAGYTSAFIDIRRSVPGAVATESLLHLKSGLAFLGDRRIVITAALENHPEFAAYDLVPVDQAELYAANCIRVNDRVLIARGFPKFEAKLRELGYQTIVLDMSEFQKMDGGLSCLSLRF
jgi:dimethylargininase